MTCFNKEKSWGFAIGWDLVIGWLFSSHGVAITSLVSSLLVAYLTSLTDKLNEYAPVSYAISFFVTLFLILIFIGILKKLFGDRLHRIETYLEISFDGGAVHYENKKNIWGWRTKLFQVSDLSVPNSTITQCWISVCFNKAISADTIKAYRIDATNSARIAFELTNFESRYSNITLPLGGAGKYRIEYHCHDD